MNLIKNDYNNLFYNDLYSLDINNKSQIIKLKIKYHPDKNNFQDNYFKLLMKYISGEFSICKIQEILNIDYDINNNKSITNNSTNIQNNNQNKNTFDNLKKIDKYNSVIIGLLGFIIYTKLFVISLILLFIYVYIFRMNKINSGILISSLIYMVYII